MVQQIIFAIIAILTLTWALRQYQRIRRNIFFGKDEEIGGNTSERWGNVVLVAFGQRKMFKNLLPAVFHFFIYAAFVITQIELCEIIIDGLFGTHRVFAPYLGGAYALLINTIEFLSILAFVATVIFLVRRNVLKVARFNAAEMTEWPKLDANLILLGEISLITGIFLMNGADVVLQQIDPAHYPETGRLVLSSMTGPLLFESLPKDALIFLERTGWWLHVLTVFAFLNYLPRSKHLHILFAFPNVWYSRLHARGHMQNIPEIQHEVAGMLGLPAAPAANPAGEIPEFGAQDIFGLSWKTILDAYTCTECGRCTAECPASITGKKLSPRKIMMDIRDRTEEVAKKMDTGAPQYIRPEMRGEGVSLNKENFYDGRSLFDYTSPEEIHACTACHACIEACPVMIDPLTPILEMRRYEILTQGSGAPDWLPMFNSLESIGSVWQMSQEREAWSKEI